MKDEKLDNDHEDGSDGQKKQSRIKWEENSKNMDLINSDEKKINASSK